jgi:hypothetical protein
MQREEWLAEASNILGDYFAFKLYRIPRTILITHERPPITFPDMVLPDPNARSCSRVLYPNVVEIFISPDVGNSYDVLILLVHELAHAVAGVVTPHAVVGYLSRWHGITFQSIASAMGLQGVPRYHYHSPKLGIELRTIIETLGFYPRELA